MSQVIHFQFSIHLHWQKLLATSFMNNDRTKWRELPGFEDNATWYGIIILQRIYTKAIVSLQVSWSHEFSYGNLDALDPSSLLNGVFTVKEALNMGFEEIWVRLRGDAPAATGRHRSRKRKSSYYIHTSFRRDWQLEWRAPRVARWHRILAGERPFYH